MDNQEYSEAIDKLSHLHQKKVGELLCAIQNKATGQTVTERKQNQNNLDQFALGMVVVYLFAIFEDYFPWPEIKKRHVFLDKYTAYVNRGQTTVF